MKLLVSWCHSCGTRTILSEKQGLEAFDELQKELAAKQVIRKAFAQKPKSPIPSTSSSSSSTSIPKKMPKRPTPKKIPTSSPKRPIPKKMPKAKKMPKSPSPITKRPITKRPIPKKMPTSTTKAKQIPKKIPIGAPLHF